MKFLSLLLTPMLTQTHSSSEHKDIFDEIVSIVSARDYSGSTLKG